MSEKIRTVMAWGGFVGGKLDWNANDTGFGGFGVGLVSMPALFKTRKEARREYQDVRRVEIREAIP